MGGCPKRRLQGWGGGGVGCGGEGGWGVGGWEGHGEGGRGGVGGGWGGGGGEVGCSSKVLGSLHGLFHPWRAQPLAQQPPQPQPQQRSHSQGALLRAARATPECRQCNIKNGANQ